MHIYTDSQLVARQFDGTYRVKHDTLRSFMARIRELEGSPGEFAALEEELRRHREDDVEGAGDLEQATMEWLRERQDAETRLQAYRDVRDQLKKRIEERFTLDLKPAH